jgi:hypothetical protein
VAVGGGDTPDEEEDDTANEQRRQKSKREKKSAKGKVILWTRLGYLHSADDFETGRRGSRRQ